MSQGTAKRRLVGAGGERSSEVPGWLYGCMSPPGAGQSQVEERRRRGWTRDLSALLSQPHKHEGRARQEANAPWSLDLRQRPDRAGRLRSGEVSYERAARLRSRCKRHNLLLGNTPLNAIGERFYLPKTLYSTSKSFGSSTAKQTQAQSPRQEGVGLTAQPQLEILPGASQVWPR